MLIYVYIFEKKKNSRFIAYFVIIIFVHRVSYALD